MKQVAFYGLVVVLWPFVTVRVVEDAIGGFASYLGFAAAAVCLVASIALAQVAAIATGLLRLIRKLMGRSRSLEAPPSLLEKCLFAGGPVLAAISIYAVTGLVLSNWARGNGMSFFVKMLALGASYGGLMAYGLLSQLVDPDDIDGAGLTDSAASDAPLPEGEQGRKDLETL